jgi:hypothetical protein
VTGKAMRHALLSGAIAPALLSTQNCNQARAQTSLGTIPGTARDPAEATVLERRLKVTNAQRELSTASHVLTQFWGSRFKPTLHRRSTGRVVERIQASPWNAEQVDCIGQARVRYR